MSHRDRACQWILQCATFVFKFSVFSCVQHHPVVQACEFVYRTKTYGAHTPDILYTPLRLIPEVAPSDNPRHRVADSIKSLPKFFVLGRLF